MIVKANLLENYKSSPKNSLECLECCETAFTQDDGARDMMSALEEVVRLRGEKEARVASLKAEAEELRARTAAEASRRDRAKLKTAEILAPVPALRQGIWVQSDLLKRLRDEVQASFL